MPKRKPLREIYRLDRIWSVRHPEEGVMTVIELNRGGKDIATYAMKSEQSPYMLLKTPRRSLVELPAQFYQT